jgi:hypothetical protein
MARRNTKFASKRVFAIRCFLQNVLNLDKNSLTLVDNLQTSVKRILSKELGFTSRFESSCEIFENLTKQSDVFGDVICLLCENGLANCKHITSHRNLLD